jgi:phospholipid transport system substrate-binding protein
MTARLAILLCGVFFLPVADRASAATADPAVTQVKTLSDALLASMRAGAAEPMSERFRKLQPVIEQVFALPLVAHLAVGPDWTNFSPDQQKDIIAAFSRFTVANYAHNFNSYDGQRFEVDDNVSTRGPDKIVRTRIIPTRDTPVTLLYRMHEVDGTWKIVDVFANGVSELAQRRTDFAAALAAGGPAELVAHLNKSSNLLMK